MLCAEFDPGRPHGHVTWRVVDALPVIELVNNWRCRSFEDTYRPPLIGKRLAQVLDAVQPDIVHLHSLLNLSLDLPRAAHARGVPVAATLHDYSLVCPSGGQRIHQSEAHVCHTIDPGRCATCFRESPLFAQASFSAMTDRASAPPAVQRQIAAATRRLPGLSAAAVRLARRLPLLSVTPSEIEARLAAARRTFEQIDLFAAPSAAILHEFVRLGIPPAKIRLSDYGLPPMARLPTRPSRGDRLRIGFVGTLVWHKGVHVLIDAVRELPANSYELTIFGRTEVSAAYASGLRRRAAGLPVTFAGGFERSDIDAVYGGIDVLVVPSLWMENSPLVVHEARAAGLPVVASRLGGLPDLIEEGHTGLLYEPSSAPALASVLRRLVDDPPLLDALTAASRALPAVKSIEDDAREWEATYATLLDRRERAAVVP